MRHDEEGKTREGKEDMERGEKDAIVQRLW